MSTATPTAESTAAGELRAIAVEAYVYLYPLLTMELSRRQMTNAPAGSRPGFGPMGAFSHFREFPSADFKAVVRPNFDTLYSSAWLDLKSEPMIVSVPDTQGRYYVLPLYDMWTDVFAVPGKRTSGTAAADYAIVPPGWDGPLPEDATRIQSPTRCVWIIGRIQTNGPADYGAVHAVQDGLAVTPLSGSGHTPEFREDRSVDMETPPLEQVHAMSARDYFSLAAELMTLHPPHMTDWSALARLERVGVRPGRDLAYDALAPEARAALDAAPGDALELMRASLPRMARIANRWQMNTDTMGVYGNYYLKRAVVTMAGLGALPPEDAVYPLNVGDADGNPLDGGNDYVMHFERDELPPAGAFWSVTMYDGDGFQVANELDRFAIGDRDELRYNEDGSLDLFLQHDRPGPEREANWLPAPRGPLGVTMRIYAPAQEVLDGRWNPPPIRLAGS